MQMAFVYFNLAHKLCIFPGWGEGGETFNQGLTQVGRLAEGAACGAHIPHWRA